MILKRSMKRIVLSSLVLFLLLLIYIMPTSKNEFNINETIEYVNSNLKTHNIFLLDNNERLSQTSVIVSSKDKNDLAKELIEYLIIDNKNQDKIPSGFKALIPANTKINSLEILDSTIKIDFNENLLDTKKEYEEKIIEAIVYNLTSLENINKVLIYINGEIITTLPKSKINLPSTLTREFGINKEYNLTSLKDVNKTTIYYVSNFNDNTYYTPITKVSNNNQDKIEIIVDELSNNTTLNSYLNYNTKLISNEINDNTMTVDFNEYVLNDSDEYEISDEVLNTISLSIYDNYDIDEIILKVNGQVFLTNERKSLE